MVIEYVVQQGLWDRPPQMQEVTQQQEAGYSQLPLWDEFALDAGRSFELYTSGPLKGLPILPGYERRGPRPTDYAKPPIRVRTAPLFPVIPLGPRTWRRF